MIKVMTREYLATYIYLESEIKRIRRRIKYYESHPRQTEYGVVKGSMDQFPFIECTYVVSGVKPKTNVEKEQQTRQLLLDLIGNEQIFEDMKLDIECFLEGLKPEDVEIKHILSLKYIERKTDREIAALLNYDHRTIGRKIEKFLDREKVA